MRPYDLLVVGELNVDIILTGDVVPRFGQVEQWCDDLTVTPGSSAAIFAAAAAKMGLRVLYVSRVGDDPFGQLMVSALRGASVDVSRVSVDPSIKTGATLIFSRGQDRAMITYPGSIAAVTDADVPSELYGLARHLHVASPFLLTGLRTHMPEMMRAAQAAGLTVSLDTNWDPEGAWALEGFFDHLDVFLPNENELLAITRADDLDEAIAQMASKVPLLVVKRGERGALGVCDEERLDVPAYPTTVADTTGAGDTFDGGFLAGWLRGEPLRRCLRLGAACAALTIRQTGGFNGQPTWEEAEALTSAPEHEEDRP
ncbi:MAG: carbohydrate kinase family protein [Anaerolineae bacterium]|nr:carbohydrate kinase family protein [Anaerolineae bacterium]